MIHQVAAHHVAAVGNARREFVAGRQQQQARAFDAVGGHDKGLAGDAVRDLVGVVIQGGHDAALVVVFELVDVGIGDQLGARRLGGIC